MDMEQGLLYLLAGYLSGSVLYARVFPACCGAEMLRKKAATAIPARQTHFSTAASGAVR